MVKMEEKDIYADIANLVKEWHDIEYTEMDDDIVSDGSGTWRLNSPRMLVSNSQGRQY